MSRKRCVIVLLLWTIASGPSPVAGSGRGDADDTEIHASGSGSRSGSDGGAISGKNGGLRKSDSLVNDFVIIKSPFGGNDTFSRVRRIRRQTSTEFLKVKLTSGSFVYRCVNIIWS